MAADQSQLEAAIGAVRDPEIGLTLGDLGLVRSVRPRRRRVHIEVALPVAAWPGHRGAGRGDPPRRRLGGRRGGGRARVRRDDRRGACRSAAPAAGRHGGRRPTTTERRRARARPRGPRARARRAPMPAFLGPDAKTRVIGVSSGKGGVGKSTVTVNLAIALAQAGHQVGLLDADVYGFSVPKMLGTDHDPIIIGDMVIPTSAHGVKCLSMGYFVPGRPAGDLARPDAAQGDPAVPDRCLLGRAGLRAHRHAAGHGGRRAHPGRGDAPGRDHRRHDAAGRGAAGGPALGVRRPPPQALRARRHREHELVHRRRREALRALRRRRRRHPGRRPRDPAARPRAAGQRGAPGRRRGSAGHRRRSGQRDGAGVPGHRREAGRARARPGSTGGSSACVEAAGAGGGQAPLAVGQASRALLWKSTT